MKEYLQRLRVKKGGVVVAGIYFLLIAVILFNKWIFLGKLPIAADLQVGNYEPWKTDLGQGVKFKPLGFDDIRIFYPQRIISTEQIKNGIIPVWNPYEFTGNVLLANSQTAIFYPPSWLFFVLPGPVAWSFLAFSTPFLAGFLMFLWLRMKVGSSAAIFGATAFALSGFQIVRIEDGVIVGQTAVWLPLALLGIERVLLKKTLSGLFLTIFSLVMSILAGWFQLTFYVLLITFLYSLFCRLKPKYIIAIFSLTVILTFYHWIPAALSLKYSPRGDSGSINLSKHLMDFPHLITYLTPDFFGNPENQTFFGKSEYKESILFIGILPLVYSLSCFFVPKLRRKTVFFLFLIIITIPLGLNLPGLASILQRIPLVSSFVPNRIFFVTTFSLCVLASYAIEKYKDVNESFRYSSIRKILFIMATILNLVVFGAACIYINEKFGYKFTRFSFFALGIERYILLSLEAVREALVVLVLTSAALLFAVRKRNRSIFLVFGFIVYLYYQFIFASKYLYFSNPENLYPNHPVIDFLSRETSQDYSRVVSLGYAKFASNTLSYYGIYDVDGVDAMYPIWYGELVGYVTSDGKSFKPQDRITASFNRSLNFRNDFPNSLTYNFFKLTGVKYVVLRQDSEKPPSSGRFKLVYTYKNWLVYEYLDSLPKANFVFDYDVQKDKGMHLKKLFNQYYSPNVTVELFDDVIDPPTSCGIGRVETLEYKPNYIKLETNANVSGFVVVNDSYFPNWKARVDGVDSRVYRANYAFRAVKVPPGKHQIIFEYRYF